MQREEPYQGLTSEEPLGNRRVPSGTSRTGAAWLSSARVVRCWVKSPQRAQPPVLSCHQVMLGTLRRTACDKQEEGGDDVKSSWALTSWGCKRATMAGTKGCDNREVEPIPKNQSQFGLESATRLHEGGIASNRGSACRGEYVPGSCTHPPVKLGKTETPEVAILTARREVPKVELSIRAKSVTR